MDGLRVHLRPAARLPSQLSKAPASPVAPPGTTPGVLVHREAPLDVRPRLPPQGGRARSRSAGLCLNPPSLSVLQLVLLVLTRTTSTTATSTTSTSTPSTTSGTRSTTTSSTLSGYYYQYY